MVTPRTGRPRGRPPGSKNLPKTLEAFVTFALAEPAKVPPRPAKKKVGALGANAKPQDPEALKRLAALGTAAGRNTTKHRGKLPGTPNGRTNKQQMQVVAEQTALIEKILKKMAKEGITPDDPMATESLKEAMVILRSQADAKTKLSAARLVLDFTKAKPTAKIEHTIRTAEDMLDEMAEDGD